MNWGGIITIFFASTVKFMFAPFSGPVLKLTFVEAYLAACAGAIFGAAIFYFSAEFFIHRAARKKHLAVEQAKAQNKPYVEKKKFTRMNRFLIRIKMKLGIIGVTFWAPFFLSIPIGSMIVAKFYGKRKITFPLICLGIFFNGIIMTGLVYLVKHNV